MLLVALFTTARTRKQPTCPSAEEWIKKMWCAHTHTHTHTQWNITQPEKNKYILTHICGNYKNGIDELICKAKTDTQMERTNVWILRGERGVGWIGRLELTYIHYYV